MVYQVPPQQITIRDLFHNLRQPRPLDDAKLDAQTLEVDNEYELPPLPSADPADQPDSILWCLEQGPFHFRHTDAVRDASLIGTHPLYPLTQCQQIKAKWGKSEPRSYSLQAGAVALDSALQGGSPLWCCNLPLGGPERPNGRIAPALPVPGLRQG